VRQTVALVINARLRITERMGRDVVAAAVFGVDEYEVSSPTKFLLPI
jgi:hypothetical protein